MEPLKINSSQASDYSDSVKRAVKQIKGLEGKKKQIDTYYEYEKLGQLLADVKAGKLDKNTIAEDEMYIKGLQLEYQKHYLGGEEPTQCGSEVTNGVQGGKLNTPFDKKQPKLPPKESGDYKKPAPAPDKTPEPHVPEPDIPTKKKPEPDTKPEPENEKNVVKDNKDNIIVSGDNNVIIKAGSIAGKLMEGAAEAATEAEKRNEAMKNSKENYTAAFAEGKQVAKDLIGYTTTAEKQNAIRYIMKQSPATIMGFISGYNENDTVLGIKYGKGGLLNQIENEFGWTKSEKQETFSKVISTVLSWADSIGLEKDHSYKELFRMLEVVLHEDGKIDTESADYLIKELVSKGMARSGI